MSHWWTESVNYIKCKYIHDMADWFIRDQNLYLLQKQVGITFVFQGVL